MQLPCQPVTRLLLLWWIREKLLGYCAIMMSPNPTLVFPSRNVPGQEGFNNSPRCQRAPLCRPTYGPWWWHVVQGAWPGVCARGPAYWCQESPGLQDAALLQGPLALGLAPPWCTAMLTARPAREPREESQRDTPTCSHSLAPANIRYEHKIMRSIQVRNLLLQSISGAAGEIQRMLQGPEDRMHDLPCHTNRAIANAIFALAANGW